MVEQTASKVPQIRFKGFEEEWEEKTLGDFGSFKNGMNFGKEAMGHGNPFVNLQNVFGQFEVDDKKLELAESSNVQRREYNLLRGDVLFIRSSVKPEGVGETALITKTLMDTTYSGFIIRYRPEVRMSHDFNRIAYRTTIVRKQILANASRSANTNINQNALKKIALGIPVFEEQIQIGEYFRELDRLTGLHQRKHGKLVTLKKGMLQKMFPLPDANTPEIRFKGFSGDWVGKKVGEICDETYGGGTPRTSERKFWEGEIPWIQSSDITDGEIFKVVPRKYISDLALRKSPTKLVPDNSIAIVTRVGVGKLALIEFCYAASQDFLSLSRLKLDQSFAVIALSILLQSKLHETQGTSIKGITKEELLAYSFIIPHTIAEQQKIGTYFRTLDSLISKHATQLQKLQQIKSACLEKMFV